MPYPVQIAPDAVIALARTMIEAEGADNLSLHKLATALGVKAPSLYRLFASKGELVRAVNLQTNQALVAAIQAAMRQRELPAAEQVLAMGLAYRQFAHDNPMTYRLAFSSVSPETRPDPDSLEALALPLQAQMAAISGQEESLAALRGLWALIHGFVVLELNTQFQRGGDLEVTFQSALEHYIAGWQSG